MGSLPFDAQMNMVPGLVVLGLRVTLPPPISTMSWPAAMSQRLICSST